MRTYLLRDLFAVRFPLFVILSYLIILLFILSSPRIVYSFDITLAWKMAEVENLAGFRAFYREEGQNYNYNNPVWNGNVKACTINNLKDGTPYYFVVRAYSTSGDESDNSNEVRYSPPVNDPPVAEANGPYRGTEGRAISFSSTGSRDGNGNPITYNWNFGDGATSTNANPLRTYAQNGTYTVRLTVSDGSLTHTDTATVTVSDIDPVADFSATPTTGSASLRVNFTASTTSYDGITSYFWNFGDGRTGTGASPSHTYTSSGTYDVSLIVREADGDTATETKTAYITVNNHPPVAEAGDNQTVNMGTVVSIDGSNSEDPDGTIVSYYWAQISGPDVMISDPMSAQTTFTAPDVGPNGESFTFRLTVTDNGGLQSTDTCTIYVTYVEEIPTLTGLSISGKSTLDENSVSHYTATALFSDGSTRIVTDIVTWSEDSSYADINRTGELSTSEVTGDEIVTITAIYNFNDTIKITEKAVVIIDISERTPSSFKPVITSPLEGQTDCELMLQLTTLPFSDLNGNTHSQSQWQISKQEDFSALILGITSSEHLTKLTTPRLVLEPETTYYVRVRFFDSYFEPSDWSDIIEFKTASDLNDVNYNGIPDDQEIVSDIDLNEDGIADNNQPDKIKCVRRMDADFIIGFSKGSDSITNIEAVEAIDPSAIFENRRRPRKLLIGLIAHRLRVNEPGITVFMRIYFSKSINMVKNFYKYNTVQGWEDYSQYVTFNYKTNSIIIELKDGGHGDSDGVANGIIVDPGGLGENDIAATNDNEITFDNGSSKGGCFIGILDFGP